MRLNVFPLFWLYSYIKINLVECLHYFAVLQQLICGVISEFLHQSMRLWLGPKSKKAVKVNSFICKQDKNAISVNSLQLIVTLSGSMEFLAPPHSIANWKQTDSVLLLFYWWLDQRCFEDSKWLWNLVPIFKATISKAKRSQVYCLCFQSFWSSCHGRRGIKPFKLLALTKMHFSCKAKQ